ncbi:MAG TPA: bifunctional glutamate N-acetyltransferase/amino-acid acetyltransferase ArgJ [Vicinamibacterales bacterium]|nr:bifunctional glutamate N-acetyltransferase/amino-acid acetyltransferase ArgJ [Vicinamibacterales bacterium]
MVRTIVGGVTAPRGFKAAGVSCGIKKTRPGASAPLDLALLSASAPVSTAAVFTTNKAIAAPIVVSREHLEQTGGWVRAVVTNSGCANAATGAQGLAAAREMAGVTAHALGCEADEVLVASTGVIGVQLDVAKIKAGVGAAVDVLRGDGADDAARAIMTTDPFPKSTAAAIDTPSGTLTVGGMAKGSGMIEPRMATMLAFLTTDARVEPAVLQVALQRVVNATFNAITVDGECSTNDCVMLLASGESGVAITHGNDPRLIEPLMHVAGHLAREIVRGGEGATKLVAVDVVGAATQEDAWRAARTIANSPLVKTAIHGGDPNWGRLIAAAGRSGAAFRLDRASVSIGHVKLFVDGTPHDERADEAAAVMQTPEMTITVDLGVGGRYSATMWTCDFSAEYVRINAEYRT